MNFDKALMGLFLLAYCQRLLNERREWAIVLKTTIPRAMVVAAVVLALALAMDYVRFDPKWTSLFYPWAWSNLFFTCLPEEALFRGFIQNQLERLFAGLQYGGVLAIS
ncbi:MAG: CPBP family intramembrane glutamate endopeptidase, partial [bacterium]